MNTNTLKSLAAGAFALGVSLSAEAAQDLPNFIIVLTDDQGWGDVGYNGHPVIKTPELDEMAKAGIRFDRFYASSSVCTPSRATAITGRNNFRLGISTPLNTGWHLSAKEITRKCPLCGHILAPPERLRALELPRVDPRSQGVIPERFKRKKL